MKKKVNMALDTQREIVHFLLDRLNLLTVLINLFKRSKQKTCFTPKIWLHSVFFVDFKFPSKLN